MGAVFQHNPQKGGRGAGAVHRFVKSLSDQQGQEAGMVNMRVGYENEVQFPRSVNPDVTIAGFNGPVALMHAAVHAKASAARLNDMAGSGDGSGRSQKLNFHERSQMDDNPTFGGFVKACPLEALRREWIAFALRGGLSSEKTLSTIFFCLRPSMPCFLRRRKVAVFRVLAHFA
jgi:hypothetical protein